MRAGQPRVGVQAAARERLEGSPGQDPAPRGGADATALERLVSVRERDREHREGGREGGEKGRSRDRGRKREALATFR